MIHTNVFRERLDDAQTIRNSLREYVEALSTSGKIPDAKLSTVQAARKAIELENNLTQEACYEAFLTTFEKQAEAFFDFTDAVKELARHQAHGVLSNASPIMNRQAILAGSAVWQKAKDDYRRIARIAININETFNKFSDGGGNPALNARAQGLIGVGFSDDDILNDPSMPPAGKNFDARRFSLKEKFTEMEVRVVEAATRNAQSILVRMFYVVGSTPEGTPQRTATLNGLMGHISGAIKFADCYEQEAREICKHLDELSLEMPAGRA